MRSLRYTNSIVKRVCTHLSEPCSWCDTYNKWISSHKITVVISSPHVCVSVQAGRLAVVLRLWRYRWLHHYHVPDSGSIPKVLRSIYNGIYTIVRARFKRYLCATQRVMIVWKISWRYLNMSLDPNVRRHFNRWWFHLMCYDSFLGSIYGTTTERKVSWQ